MENKYNIVNNQDIDFLRKNETQLICPYQMPVPVPVKSNLLGGQQGVQMVSKPCCSQCALFELKETKVILHCGSGIFDVERIELEQEEKPIFKISKN